MSYIKSKARFNVVPAGRRGGKTDLLRRKMVKAGMNCIVDDGWFVLAAPTYNQAKRLFWKKLKKLVPRWIIRSISESELSVHLLNGAEIQVLGLDSPERIEGRPLDGIGLDEYGNMKESTWSEHVRPALTDRGGWADFIGVPEGRNHYYDLHCEAAEDETGEWATHHWTTAEVLPLYRGKEAAALEIASAQRSLDPMTFDQEYNASFVTFSGLAYYTFKRETHAVDRLSYDPAAPLILMMDFNQSPGTANIGQEGLRGTEIIDECHIDKGSKTPRICDMFLNMYGPNGNRLPEKIRASGHQQDLLVYGDATGGAGGSAKVDGSDWDLVRKKLKPIFGSRLKIRVPEGNPRERARVNAMCSRLLSADGTVALRVDPINAPHTVKDFEAVVTLPDGSIHKEATPAHTHHTDGIGYYVARRFPVSGGGVTFSRAA